MSESTGATREDDASQAPGPARAEPAHSGAEFPAAPAFAPSDGMAFSVGAATVPSPAPFPAPDPAFAAPAPGYTPTPYPPDPAAFGQPYGAQAYPAYPQQPPAYPAVGYPVPAQPAYGGYGGYGAVPGAYPAYVAPVKTNGLAIGSMVT